MLVTLREVLSDAQKNHYAVGLFNTVNQEMLRAVLAAAEEEKSPVIIGTAEVLLPYGSLELIAPSMLEQAKRASVPVVVHFDHGLSFEATVKALHLGFSSVMFDGSTYSYDENIVRTREIVNIAHAIGASVEAELGHVGGSENTTSDDYEEMYTDPLQAVDFLQKTGVDALAVAIGTAHGQYKIKPNLDMERLKMIREKVNTPLVLHGGSGLSDEDFKNCIQAGIAKVNIFTDLTLAAMNSLKTELLIEDRTYLDLINKTVDAIKAEAVKKIRLFGSNGRA